MSYDLLRFRFLGTGLLSAWLLIGCGGDAAAPASDDDTGNDTSGLDDDASKGGSSSTGTAFSPSRTSRPPFSRRQGLSGTPTIRT